MNGKDSEDLSNGAGHTLSNGFTPGSSHAEENINGNGNSGDLLWTTELSRERELLRVRPAEFQHGHQLTLDAVAGLEELLRKEAGGLPGIALDLRNCAIEQPVLQAILQAVERSGVPCKRLDLLGNDLHDDALEPLVAFLSRQSQAFELIDCSKNYLTAMALARLCTAMESHPGRAYPDVSDGFAMPCRLNFAENCVCREHQVLQVLRDGGIKMCTMARCPPNLCSFMAPVHYEGLGSQRDVIPWEKEDLLSVLPVRADLRPPLPKSRLDWQGLPEPVAPQWWEDSCQAPQSKPGQMSRGPAATGAPPSIPGLEEG